MLRVTSFFLHLLLLCPAAFASDELKEWEQGILGQISLNSNVSDIADTALQIQKGRLVDDFTRSNTLRKFKAGIPASIQKAPLRPSYIALELGPGLASKALVFSGAMAAFYQQGWLESPIKAACAFCASVAMGAVTASGVGRWTSANQYQQGAKVVWPYVWSKLQERGVWLPAKNQQLYLEKLIEFGPVQALEAVDESLAMRAREALMAHYADELARLKNRPEIRDELKKQLGPYLKTEELGELRSRFMRFHDRYELKLDKSQLLPKSVDVHAAVLRQAPQRGSLSHPILDSPSDARLTTLSGISPIDSGGCDQVLKASLKKIR